METIEQFAEQYKVKAKKDDCGSGIIPGKVGHIGDGYPNGQLGVCLLFNTAGKYNNAKRVLLTSGMTLRQDGHTEGVLTFDSANRIQARLALKLARVKTTRQAIPPSPAQIAARQAFAASRRKPLQSVAA